MTFLNNHNEKAIEHQVVATSIRIHAYESTRLTDGEF